MKKNNIVEIIGKRYDNLIVVGEIKKNNEWRVHCKCDCGKDVFPKYHRLIQGKAKSCGCYFLKRAEHIYKPIHGLSKHPLHTIWRSMLSRCNTPSASRYNYYGARGIKVCDEWSQSKGAGFKSFYDWAMLNGYKKGLTIDRIDVNGNYEPLNCKWVTSSEQCHNQNIRKNNTSGVQGVYWCKDRNKWQASITLNCKKIRLGYFSDFGEAVNARKEAELKYWNKSGELIE